MAVKLLDRPENPASSVECRVYERQSCDVPASCRPASALGNPEARWDGLIRDISQGGARLVLKRRFEPGTGLAIELPGADEPYTVLARVIYVQRTEDGFWSLGCRFISELSDTEQDRVINWSPPKEEETPEVIPGVKLRILANDAVLLECRVRQFTPHAEWPLAEGEAFDLRGKGTDGKPWKVTVRVLDCSVKKGDWTLTCEMVKMPSAATLLKALGES